jgi:hypothetical protein
MNKTHIIQTIGNVYFSLVGIVDDKNKMPKTYLGCLDLFPQNDTEIVEILGNSIANVKKFIIDNHLQNFVDEVYVAHLNKDWTK